MQPCGEERRNNEVVRGEEDERVRYDLGERDTKIKK